MNKFVKIAAYRCGITITVKLHEFDLQNKYQDKFAKDRQSNLFCSYANECQYLFGIDIFGTQLGPLNDLIRRRMP